MKNLFSYVKRAPKRIGFFAGLLLALVALPLNSALAADVLMESTLGVANQTTGETTYKSSTNASYDQVVKFSIWYHNRELPDSGRVAKDFKINTTIPTAAGTNQVVKVTVGGSNTNTVTNTATVNLDRADAHIEFIPGSVYWKGNVGTRANPNIVTKNVPDSAIFGGVVPEINTVNPCHEFEASVSFMARVKIPSVGIYKYVHKEGDTAKATDHYLAQPGARVEYIVEAKNLSNENLTNVYLRDPLPKGVTFVPGSAKKYYGQYNGTVMTADEATAFFTGKKNVGTLLPGGAAYITFVATVDGADKLACGTNTIKNIAVVDTDQTGEYNDSAIVTVNKTCENPKQSATCDMLTVDKLANRQVKLGVKYTVNNGATFKNVSYDFGDGTPALVTDKTADVMHTYAKDGEYHLAATVRFSVDGADKTAVCENKVVFTSTPTTPETPTVLPNTGAGSVAGLFVATSAIGAAAHRVLTRRVSRD